MAEAGNRIKPLSAEEYEEWRLRARVLENDFLKKLEKGPSGKPYEFTQNVAVSTWDNLNFLLNLTNRAAFTLGRTTDELAQGDPGLYYGQTMPKHVTSLLAKHWESDDAKEWRIRNTWAGESYLRAIYTTINVPNLARFSGTDLGTEDLAKLFQSEEAGEFAERYGLILADLPSMMAFDTYGGVLTLLSKGKQARELLAFKKELANLPSAPDFKQVAAWLERFEGGIMSDNLVRAIMEAKKKGLDDAIEQTLFHRAGMRVEGWLNRAEEGIRSDFPLLAENLGLPWFRPAGYSFTPAQNAMRQDYMLMMERAAMELDGAIEANPTLSKFFREATTQELFQYLAAMSDQKNMKRMSEGIVSGRIQASGLVADALRETLNIRKVNALFMNKNWNEAWYKAMREERFTRELKLWKKGMEAAGKPIPKSLETLHHTDLEVVKDLKTGKLDLFDKRSGQPLPVGEKARKRFVELFRSKPSIIPWPYRRIFVEGIQGEAKNIRPPAVRLRKELNRGKSQKATAAYLRAMKKAYEKDPDAVREATRKMLDELLHFQQKELKDGAGVAYDIALKKYKDRIIATDSLHFGTQERKEEVLRRADDTLKFLDQVRGVYGDEQLPFATKALRNSLWAWDSVNKAQKSAILFSPGMFMQYVSQNLPDNIGKGVFAEGGARFIDDLPTHRVDGTRINAAVSRAPTFDGRVGFESLERIKQSKTPVGTAWRWWSDAVDKVNYWPEYWGKELGWRKVYQDVGNRLTAPGGLDLDPVTLDRMKAQAADVAQDAYQFYTYPASVALSWAERLSPFAIYQTRALQAAGRIMMERPVLTHATYDLYDKLSESDVLPGGKLRVNSLGIDVPIANVVPFMRIQDTLKKAPGLDLRESPEEIAASALGSAGTIVKAFAGGGYHFTEAGGSAFLRAMQLPVVALTKKNTVETEDGVERRAFVTGIEELSRKQANAERYLEPINRFSRLFTGRNISDFYDPYREEKKTLIEYRGKWLEEAGLREPGAVSLEIAKSDVRDDARIQAGIKMLLPLSAQLGKSPGEQQVRSLMRIYETLDGPDSRRAFMNGVPKDRDGVPVLKGLVSEPDNIPAWHPKAAYLSTIEQALDNPEEAIERFNRGTESEQKAGARQFLDFFMGLLASDAGAAETPQSKSARKALDKAPNLPRIIEAANEGLAQKEPFVPGVSGFEKENFTPRLLGAGKGLVWDFYPGVNRDSMSPSALARLETRNGALNTSLREWMGGLQTLAARTDTTNADYEKWKQGYTLGPSRGTERNWQKVGGVDFFLRKTPEGQPLIAEWLHEATTRGIVPLNSKGQPIEGAMPVFLRDDANGGFQRPSDALTVLRYNQLPESHRIKVEKREKAAKDLERQGWQPIIQQMQAVGRNPDGYDVAAKWNELNADILRGRPGGPPRNLIERMLTSGEHSDLSTLSDFAIALEGEKALKLAPLMKDINGHWSPNAISFLAASGFGDEVRTLAASTKDKYLNAAVEGAGLDVDAGSVRQDALENFVALQNGIEITPQMRAASGTFLSMRGQKVNAPEVEGEQAASGAEVGAMPAGQPLRGGIEPLAVLDAASRVAAIIPTRKLPGALVEAQDMQVGPYRFSGVRDFREFTFEETRRKNLAFKQEYAAGLANSRLPQGATPEQRKEALASAWAEVNEAPNLHPEIPQTNFMQEALRNLPGLPVSFYAGATADIFRTGYNLGLVEYDTVRTIERGVTQVRTQEQLQGLTTAVLSLSSNAMAGMAYAERISFLRATGAAQLKEAASLSAASGAGLDKLDVFSARAPGAANQVRAVQLAREGQSAINYANYATYASVAGQALSFGAGVAQAQGEEDLAQGLGTAGGALQGAAYGASLGGGWGAVIGAAVGGAVGYFTSTGGHEDNGRQRDYSAARESYYAAAAENQRRQAAEAEGRSVSTRQRTLAYQQGESLRRSPQTAQNMIQRFIRRPQFGSSQGLVQATERSAGRQFIPRY